MVTDSFFNRNVVFSTAFSCLLALSSLVVLAPKAVAAVRHCEHLFSHMTQSASQNIGSDISVVNEEFARAYVMEGPIYRPAQCGRNVKNLLLYFEQNGVELVRPRIIMLTHEVRQIAGGPALKSSLQPAYSRRHERDWTFHVVLRIDHPATGQSLVLDLDGRSQPVPIKQYFQNMFPSPPRTDRWSALFLREIDAETYLHAFEEFHANASPNTFRDENAVVGRFYVDQENAYPVVSLREYLYQRSK